MNHANINVTSILVTGGAGYVGSHASKSLARAGFTPVVYDNLANGHTWAVKWGPLEKGDILDPQRLRAVMDKYRPQAVMHFAAFTQVEESVRNPAKYYRNNVVGTLTLLEAMRAAGIDKLVFSSSAAVYGLPASVPIDEAAERQPINPYGASKRIAEDLIRDFGAAYRLRSVVLRYFNAGGADLDGDIGEDHEPETRLIPCLLNAIVGNEEAFTIYGSDYDTADGTCVRDYIHVTDLAQAHVLAVNMLMNGGEGGVFNLGSGAGASVKEIVAAAERICGKSVPVCYGARRPGDPPSLIASNERARRHLGWSPKHSDLDTIIRSAWMWFQSK